MTTIHSVEFADRIDSMVEQLVLNVLTGLPASPSERAHKVAVQLRMLGMLPVDAEWGAFNPMGRVMPEPDAATAAQHAELLSNLRPDLPAVPMMRYVAGYQKVTSGRNPAEYDGFAGVPDVLVRLGEAGTDRPRRAAVHGRGNVEPLLRRRPRFGVRPLR